MSWVGAVDVGSVSAKLLLSDGTERLRLGVDTMLGGSSLSATGTVRSEAIAADALDRLDKALARFAPLIAERDASIRVVATATARRATNADALVALVAQRLGSELEILSEGDEARWSFVGAVSDPCLVASAAGPVGSVITVDIGGASTEFAIGSAGGPARTWSVPLGGTLLTSAYLHTDPPGPEELSAALSVVGLHVDDVTREVPELGPALDTAVVLGLGATVTIAAIEVGLVDVDPNTGDGDGPLHGFMLTRDAVEDVFRTIATETASDRAHNPGLPATRVHDIVGACALLVETMRQLDLDRVVVSQRGLVDGVAGAISGS